MMRQAPLLRLAAPLLLAGPVACGSPPDPEPQSELEEEAVEEAVADPVPVGYVARGNEPFWSLTFGEGTIELARLGASDTIRAERPTAERLEDGWRFEASAAGEPYVVRIERRLCHDTMSGRPFPHTVEVTVAGERLTGCGGDTAALLTGEEWRVVRLEDQEPVDPAPTLRFEPDGSLTGTGSCNRYRATYEITGEGIVLGPAAATRMACPQPGVDAQEMRFFAALERVTRFDLTEDGSLVLLALDTPVVVARR